MNDFIQNNITWDKLPSDRRDEFVLSAEHACLLREKKELQLDVSLNFIIPHCDIDSINSVIKSNFSDINSIVWQFSYGQMVMEKEDIIKNYIPYMADSLNSAGGMLSAVNLNDYEYSSSQGDGSVVFRSINRNLAENLNDTKEPI